MCQMVYLLENCLKIIIIWEQGDTTKIGIAELLVNFKGNCPLIEECIDK